MGGICFLVPWRVSVFSKWLGCIGVRLFWCKYQTGAVGSVFLKLHRYVCLRRCQSVFNAQALAKEVSTEARLLVEGLQGRPGLRGYKGCVGGMTLKITGLDSKCLQDGVGG